MIASVLVLPVLSIPLFWLVVLLSSLLHSGLQLDEVNGCLPSLKQTRNKCMHAFEYMHS